MSLHECPYLRRRGLVSGEAAKVPFTVLDRILVLPSRATGKRLTMLDVNSEDYELQIRQGPERARVAGAKEKGILSFHGADDSGG